MGIDVGQFLVLDRQTGKKICAGFPTLESAHRYISERRQKGKWSTARFTAKGISPIAKPVPKRGGKRRRITPRVRDAILDDYTGAWGELKQIARSFDLPYTTVCGIVSRSR